MDGKEGPEYDGITEDSPIFSPDSKHVAYGASKEEKMLAVIDDLEGVKYDMIMQNGPTFSIDGVLDYLGARDNSLFRVKHIP